MSGEVRITPGKRLDEGERVTIALVNEMFSGMTAEVRPGSVGERELADGAITAAKLADSLTEAMSIPDGSITTAKLADGCLSADAAGRGKMADGFVTEALLAADAVTSAKLAGGVNVQTLRNDQEDVDGAQGSGVGATWTSVMSVAITPSKTSSKVLVVFAGVVGGDRFYYNSVTLVGIQQYGIYKITRQIGAGAESDILVGGSAGSRIQVTGGSRHPTVSAQNVIATAGYGVQVPYLDSPATVSEVTYRVYVRVACDDTGGGNAFLNITTNTGATARGPKSSLIVVEVNGA